jgi:hypothetical protein
MADAHPIVEALRKTLAASRGPAAFVGELEGRIRQLGADMVDGRVLPRAEADALRTAMIELVRAEALPKFARGNPSHALRILDLLKAYGYTQLEGERAAHELARAARFPPPQPAAWPELDELRAAAAQHRAACRIGAPVPSVSFAEDLAAEGLALPPELLALYAWADGFDLACIAAPFLPVFSLLSSRSIDVSDAESGYPKRAAVFQGGDEAQLCVHRDRKQQWWLVYEHEFQPIAKLALELRSLLRFGLARMNAPTSDALAGELAWDRFFAIAKR